jgi:hypothetical protein
MARHGFKVMSDAERSRRTVPAAVRTVAARKKVVQRAVKIAQRRDTARVRTKS